MTERLKGYFQNRSNQCFVFLCAWTLILLVFGICLSPIKEIVKGIGTIATSSDILITDYFARANIGAAFVNSAILSFLMIIIIKLCKVPFNGAAISAIGITSGFALFGKNILNVWPIMFGAFLYAKVKGEKFGKHINVAILGATMGPLVSELLYYPGWSLGVGIPVAIVVGVLVGFILPPIAAATNNIHQGYVLYNTGIAAGCILVVVVGIMKVFNFQFTSNSYWSTSHTTLMMIALLVFSLLLVIIGVIIDKNAFIDGIKISRYSGRAVTDTVNRDGLPATLVNMGLLGILATIFTVAVGADLSGVTVGAIITIIFFGAIGKNVRNVAYILIGGLIGHLFGVWDYSIDRVAIVGILFATGIAPLGGQYGWYWGIIAGFLHCFIVKNTSVMHMGLTLYSNGFAEMFTAIVLLPIISIFYERKLKRNERKRAEDSKDN